MKWHERLRQERLSRGWTQSKLAQKLGIHKHTIARWENGYAFPHPYYREKLTALLGANFEERDFFEAVPQIDHDTHQQAVFPLEGELVHYEQGSSQPLLTVTAQASTAMPSSSREQHPPFLEKNAKQLSCLQKADEESLQPEEQQERAPESSSCASNQQELLTNSTIPETLVSSQVQEAQAQDQEIPVSADALFSHRPSMRKGMPTLKGLLHRKVTIPLTTVGLVIIAGLLMQTYGIVGNPAPSHSDRSTLISLSKYMNNKGIGNIPGQGNFDGSGYSYPADQLPPAGRITLNGLPYQFPGSAPGANDNVVALGQSIQIPPGNYQQAWLLVASSWGWSTSRVTMHYADTSTNSTVLNVPDWLTSPAGAVNSSYRYTPGGIQPIAVHIYTVQIPINKTKVMNSLTLLTLPSTPAANPVQPSLHVFALTLQS